MPPFCLSRATVADLPELLELMYKSFSTWTTSRYMGCFSPDDVPKYVAEWTTTMAEDPTDIWIKVTDNQTGEIVAASNWKLYLGSDKAIERARDEPPEWLSEDLKEKSRELLVPSNEARIPANPDPFLREYPHQKSTNCLITLSRSTSFLYIGTLPKKRSWSYDGKSNTLCLKTGCIRSNPFADAMGQRSC